MGYTHCKVNEPVFKGITCPYNVGTDNVGQNWQKNSHESEVGVYKSTVSSIIDRCCYKATTSVGLVLAVMICSVCKSVRML